MKISVWKMILIKYYITLLIFFVKSSRASIKNFKNYLIESPLTPSVFVYFDYIIGKYFKNESLLLIYSSNSSFHFFDEFVQYYSMSGNNTWEVCKHDKDQNFRRRLFADNVIIFFDQLDQVKSVRHCLSWNARSRTILIVHEPVADLSEIFRKFWTDTKAIHVTLMLIIESSVRFFTYYPYHNFKIEEIDVERNQIDHVEFFPNKVPKNFNNTILYFGTWPFIPYVLNPPIPGDFQDGLEIRIIKVISKHFNFRIAYKPLPKGEHPWMMWSRDFKKLRGLFGLLDRLEVDIIFQGLRVRHDRFYVADGTAVYAFDDLVWIFPKKIKSHEWESLFEVFDFYIWYWVLASTIFASITIFLLRKYEVSKGKKSKFSMWLDGYLFVMTLLLINSMNYKPKSVFLRGFIGFVLFFALNITFAYQSGLIMHLTSPRSEQLYKTLKDAVEGGLVAHLHPAGRQFFNTTDHDLWNKILAPKRHVFTWEYEKTFYEMAYNKTVYASHVKEFVKFLISIQYLDAYNQPMIYIGDERRSPYLLNMYLSKGHPLTNLVSMTLLRLVEGGLVEYFGEKLKSEYRKKGSGESVESGPKPLTLTHLQGAFSLICFMLILSTLIFFVEFFPAHCKRWGKKALKWRPRILRRKVGNPSKRWADDIRFRAEVIWLRRAKDRTRWKVFGDTYVQDWPENS